MCSPKTVEKFRDFLTIKEARQYAISSTMMHGNRDVKLCGVEYPVNWCRFERIDMECRH
jgi:hypothetical protein